MTALSPHLRRATPWWRPGATASISTKRRMPAFAFRRVRTGRTGEPAKRAPLFADSFTRASRPEATGAASRVLADVGIPCTAEDNLRSGCMTKVDEAEGRCGLTGDLASRNSTTTPRWPSRTSR